MRGSASDGFSSQLLSWMETCTALPGFRMPTIDAMTALFRPAGLLKSFSSTPPSSGQPGFTAPTNARAACIQPLQRPWPQVAVSSPHHAEIRLLRVQELHGSLQREQPRRMASLHGLDAREASEESQPVRVLRPG